MSAFVTVEASTVEALLAKAHTAVSPYSFSYWLRSYMAPELQRRAGERFATESDPDGRAWAPLSDATIRIREEQGYWPGLINWRTGEMERYITQASAFVSPTGDGAFLQYPGQEATGEMAEKIRTAQAGKSDPSTPARPVLGVSTADAAFALASLEAWLTAAIVSGGMVTPS